MDSCTTCKVWVQEKEALLKECDSVFEAAAKLHSFEQQCEKHCMFNKGVRDKTNLRST